MGPYHDQYAFILQVCFIKDELQPDINCAAVWTVPRVCGVKKIIQLRAEREACFLSLSENPGGTWLKQCYCTHTASPSLPSPGASTAPWWGREPGSSWLPRFLVQRGCNPQVSPHSPATATVTVTTFRHKEPHAHVRNSKANTICLTHHLHIHYLLWVCVCINITFMSPGGGFS